MATKDVTVEKVVKEAKRVRVSDFSGMEIPNFHWSVVTNIACFTSDHGFLTGNRRDVFSLDLLPEEMQDFKKSLQDLIDQMKLKYSARNIRGI